MIYIFFFIQTNTPVCLRALLLSKTESEHAMLVENDTRLTHWRQVSTGYNVDYFKSDTMPQSLN